MLLAWLIPTTILAGSSPLTVAGAISSSADLSLVAGSGGIAINAAVNTATHNLTINSGGPVTQSATIAASGLELLGNGSFTLTLPDQRRRHPGRRHRRFREMSEADEMTLGIVGSTIGIATGNQSRGESHCYSVWFLTVDQLVDTSAGTGGVFNATGVVLNAVPVSATATSYSVGSITPRS